MSDVTWQVVVFVAYRVASAIPTLRWPLGGALLALVADFSDLFLMDWIGGIADYQRLDKVCDLAYLVVFLVMALRWHGIERQIAVALFAYRMIGEALFELTGAREALLVFPNVFEFWFIAVAARDHYRPSAAIRPRSATIALVALLAAKEAQEYFLHVDRFLDGFSAFDALSGTLRTIFGR